MSNVTFGQFATGTMSELIYTASMWIFMASQCVDTKLQISHFQSSYVGGFRLCGSSVSCWLDKRKNIYHITASSVRHAVLRGVESGASGGCLFVRWFTRLV